MTTKKKLFGCSVDSPVGALRLVAADEGLAAVHFLAKSQARSPAAEDAERHPVLERVRRELEEYFAGKRTHFETPLAPPSIRGGTEFQVAVWDALVAIPFGETRSYGAIARAIGRPSAVRAVGNANRVNPIAIIVPCHRVIGESGSLTGYAGGLPIKSWLLAHEAGPLLSAGAGWL
jgi:methylated-DNA-[protein]-cysteine S-methyltransferase